MEEQVIPGSTKAAHQFGLELKHQLNYLASHPHEVCKAAQPQSLLKEFQNYLRNKTGHPDAFSLLLFKSPKKARSNQHHWIIIDDGYYVDFFERQLAVMKDYRALSETFLREFCAFNEAHHQEWVRDFHVHFLKADKIGLDMGFWKRYIIARHPQSDLSFILTAYAYLWQIDDREYPKVGYRPVDPQKLYAELRGDAASA